MIKISNIAKLVMAETQSLPSFTLIEINWGAIPVQCLDEITLFPIILYELGNMIYRDKKTDSEKVNLPKTIS